jgi:hypothetical protein
MSESTSIPEIYRSSTCEQLVKENGVYRWGRLIVQNGLTEQMLVYAYLRFQQDKLLPIIFYEGIPEVEEFLRIYTDPASCTLGCFEVVESTETANLAGLCFINDRVKMGPNHARINVGEAFFRGHGVDVPVRFGQMCLEWIWDNIAVDAVGGVTPAPNRAALLFSRKLGFTVVGPLPGGTVWNGELCDVYLSSMTKQMWQQLRPWKE